MKEIKYDLGNLSGIYPEVDINAIPFDILSSIKEAPTHALSYPFESQNESVYLAYVFEKTGAIKPTLENSWETVTGFAKNDKMNTIFLTWLNENKEKTFIKIFHP